MAGTEPNVTDHAIRRFVQYTETFELADDYKITPFIFRRYLNLIREYLRRAYSLSAACRVPFITQAEYQQLGKAVLSGQRDNAAKILERADYRFDPVSKLCFVLQEEGTHWLVVTVLRPNPTVLKQLQVLSQTEARENPKPQPASEAPVQVSQTIPVSAFPLEICVLTSCPFNQDLIEKLLTWIARSRPTPQHTVQLLASPCFTSWLFRPLQRRFPHAYLLRDLPSKLVAAVNQTGLSASSAQQLSQLMFRPAASGFEHTLMIVIPEAIDTILWLINRKLYLDFGTLNRYHRPRTVIGINPRPIGETPDFSVFKL